MKHCSAGGFFGDSNRVFHIARLSPAENAQANGRKDQSDSGDKKTEGIFGDVSREIGEVSREIDNSPIEIRPFGALLGLLFYFFMCLLGWRDVYNDRGLCGALSFVLYIRNFCLNIDRFALHIFRRCGDASDK